MEVRKEISSIEAQVKLVRQSSWFQFLPKLKEARGILAFFFLFFYGYHFGPTTGKKIKEKEFGL